VIGYFAAFHQEGKTVLTVTHDPRAAERANRTLRLAEGQIVSAEKSGGRLHVA
jgi:putative ABC transport system ATP-binding protein